MTRSLSSCLLIDGHAAALSLARTGTREPYPTSRRSIARPAGSDATNDTGLTCCLRGYEAVMIVVGIVLLLLGFLLGVPLLWTLGVIVLIVGVVLMLLGSTGRAVGGRRHYW